MPVSYLQQLDSQLMERLLTAPGVPPSVFSSKVLRALINFKWHYFIKYFIIMQLLLHLVYMAVFLAYAFSIKDLEPVEGRHHDASGPTPMWGTHGSATCRLAAPTTLQFAYLCALGAITIDFASQEARQLWHFGTRYFTHPWDVLDILSVALMTCTIIAHFLCALGPLEVGPSQLRGMAAGQVLLLFMRLLYYAMAFEELGSFVRMVLALLKDLLLFAAFLVVVIVGFALAILIAQGAAADSSNGWKVVFLKLYTMIYGDFDMDFLEQPWNAAAAGSSGTDSRSGEEDPVPLNTLISVFIAVFMVVVTIILLNLLIAIVNESYDRIRANAHFESLRNKALLIVSTESLLRRVGVWAPFLMCSSHYRASDGHFIDWIYSTLAAPLGPGPVTGDSRTNKGAQCERYVYVITPERPRDKVRDGAGGGAAFEDDGDHDGDGRLGDLRRMMADTVVSTVALSQEATRQAVREEIHTMTIQQQQQLVAAAVHAVPAPAEAGAQSRPSRQGRSLLRRAGSDAEAEEGKGGAGEERRSSGGGMDKGRAAAAVRLGEEELRRVAELVAEALRTQLLAQQQQQRQSHQAPQQRRPSQQEQQQQQQNQQTQQNQQVEQEQRLLESSLTRRLGLLPPIGPLSPLGQSRP